MPYRRWVPLLLLASACFSDTTVAEAGETDGCEAGELGCACFGNQTCIDELTCNASVERCIREDCMPGQQLCPCDGSTCDAGLVCEDALCVSDGGMTSGTTGGTGTATTPTDSTTSTTPTVSSTDPSDPMTTEATLSSSSDPTEDSDSSTEPGPPVTLFFSDGNFLLAAPDGPARAAQSCAAAALSIECGNVAALVSTAEGHTVANAPLPPNSPLVNEAGDLVADDLATLISEGPTDGQTLESAGVRTVGEQVSPQNFATGSDIQGGLGANCVDWSEVNTQAVVGSSQQPGTGWLDAGGDGSVTVQCEVGASLAILCACWAS